MKSIQIFPKFASVNDYTLANWVSRAEIPPAFDKWDYLGSDTNSLILYEKPDQYNLSLECVNFPGCACEYAEEYEIILFDDFLKGCITPEKCSGKGHYSTWPVYGEEYENGDCEVYFLFKYEEDNFEFIDKEVDKEVNEDLICLITQKHLSGLTPGLTQFPDIIKDLIRNTFSVSFPEDMIKSIKSVKST